MLKLVLRFGRTPGLVYLPLQSVEDWQREVRDYKGTVLALLSADFVRGKNVSIKKSFNKLLAQHKQQVKFVELDVDKCSNLAEGLQVMKVPTLLVVNRGRSITRFEGMPEPSSIQLLADKVVQQLNSAARPAFAINEAIVAASQKIQSGEFEEARVKVDALVNTAQCKTVGLLLRANLCLKGGDGVGYHLTVRLLKKYTEDIAKNPFLSSLSEQTHVRYQQFRTSLLASHADSLAVLQSDSSAKGLAALAKEYSRLGLLEDSRKAFLHLMQLHEVERPDLLRLQTELESAGVCLLGRAKLRSGKWEELMGRQPIKPVLQRIYQ